MHTGEFGKRNVVVGESFIVTKNNRGLPGCIEMGVFVSLAGGFESIPENRSCLRSVSNAFVLV